MTGYEKFQISIYPYFKDYFMAWLPECMICCKLNREERAFEKAREKLEQELNMLELLKS